ncbi:MAG TPA: glycosyltransferase [Candidatus Acidoferrum sp.]|nr:glycosyltransferase [Candidatus Acidoferrum sp.]
MDRTSPQQKLAILINTISPARIPLYSGLASHFDLLLLHGGNESNRDTWQDMQNLLPEAKVVKAWGWQIRLARKLNGAIFDHRYLHFTPGFLWHLLKFRPAVLVSNEMGFRTLLALAYGTLARKPVWVWWGGTLHTERGVGLVKRLLRRFISYWAKHWISYGKSSTEYLVSLGIDRDRVLEIQNAVDEHRFSAPSGTSAPLLPRPVLLHVGQFTARKGIALLLHAAAAQQREGRLFSLLLVGSGPDKCSTEKLSKGLGLKNVHFLPPEKPDQMPAIYKRADVLIFPTLEDVWGLVANEALLSGLPVLCSKYAGCADELLDPENIFDPNNSQEFAKKLGDAIEGRLPMPLISRLRPTSCLVADLARALSASSGGPMESASDAPEQLHV